MHAVLGYFDAFALTRLIIPHIRQRPIQQGRSGVIKVYMTGKFTKGIEISANIAIIIVAVLLGVILVSNYMFTGTRSVANTTPPIITTGTKLSLLDVK